MSQPVLGVTGWKNSGKTTLVERLLDVPGTDSFRHRQAGASEVAIVSARRWALMHELRDEDEPPLASVLARLAPCELVIVEGYKREGHPKIEARRLGARDTTPLSAQDPSIVAVAADHAQPGETLPVFDIDDIAAIADFAETFCAPRV